ncbi:MAG: hypothetical protein JW716_03335 [Candidatus Aenigmarchaeota archaeon]|nr:hypothetical protein [Candidatus Aenigmarchaeota archaeon]
MKLLEHIFCRKNIARRNFIIFSILLNGIGLAVVLSSLVSQRSTYYLIIYLVSGATGLLIETVGTHLGCWEYYNNDKLPWISFFGWGSAVAIVLLIINFFGLV